LRALPGDITAGGIANNTGMSKEKGVQNGEVDNTEGIDLYLKLLPVQVDDQGLSATVISRIPGRDLWAESEINAIPAIDGNTVERDEHGYTLSSLLDYLFNTCDFTSNSQRT